MNLNINTSIIFMITFSVYKVHVLVFQKKILASSFINYETLIFL